MLAGGIALIIPAVVLSLNATRFQPEEGTPEDAAPTGPAAEPGNPSGSVVNGTGNPSSPNVAPPPSGPPAPALPPPPPPTPTPAPAPTPPPQSLFDIHRGEFRLGIPVPNVVPVFSLAEQKQYGLHAETELRMPMVHMTF